MTGWCWAKQFSFNKYDLSAVSRNQHQANVSYFVSADGISGTNRYIQTLVIRFPFCQKCRAPKQKRSCAKTSKPGKKIDVVTSYASITAVLDQKTKNETVLRLGVPFSCLTRMFQERHHICSNTIENKTKINRLMPIKRNSIVCWIHRMSFVLELRNFCKYAPG